MPNYFLCVRYKGKKFAGFQIQENAITVQGEIEKALEIFFKQKIQLTGSSRTDAGVHAKKNYFHFQSDLENVTEAAYHLNAILMGDIAVEGIYSVPEDAHARFTAVAREYSYHIYSSKNPFLEDQSWYYPYPLDIGLMNEAALVLKGFHDFTSFSKKNTQVFTNNCTVAYAGWAVEGEEILFRVKGNRFLRGMVRAMVGTMVKVGRGKLSVKDFAEILAAKDNTLADFSAPAHGLFLEDVEYPPDIQQLISG
jgi:tRNA pseudouridine38-40 synthase